MYRDLFLVIKSYRFKFTNVEKLIADYFLKKKEPLTIDELAKKLFISPASITRFCKKLGFNNYKEFIYLYKEKLNSIEIESATFNNIQQGYLNILKDVDENFDREVLINVCEAIHKKKIIHLFGLGSSGLAADDFKFRFSRIGKFIEVIKDYNSVRMLMPILNKSSLIFILSLRGKSEDAILAAKNAKVKGATVISITSNHKSELIKYSDHTIYTAKLDKVDAMGNISGQIPLVISIDLIYSLYVDKYKNAVKKWFNTEKAINKSK